MYDERHSRIRFVNTFLGSACARDSSFILNKVEISVERWCKLNERVSAAAVIGFRHILLIFGLLIHFSPFSMGKPQSFVGIRSQTETHIHHDVALLAKIMRELMEIAIQKIKEKNAEKSGIQFTLTTKPFLYSRFLSSFRFLFFVFLWIFNFSLVTLSLHSSSPLHRTELPFLLLSQLSFGQIIVHGRVCRRFALYLRSESQSAPKQIRDNFPTENPN